MTAPSWTLQAISGSDRVRPVVLLMRHAARGPLPADNAAGDVPILPEGAVAARALGRTIGARLTTLRTSPMLRCVQTADALRAGSERMIEPVEDKALGSPGLFVTDVAVAWKNWDRLGHEAVMAGMIAGRQLPGMAAPKDAARRLVAHAIEVGGATAGVHVLVTHDSLLAATVAHTLGILLPRPEWPAFLEALVLTPGPDGLRVRWRDREEVISST